MKIYSYVEIDANGATVDEVSYEHQGKTILCKGGGGSSTTYTTPPAWLNQYMPMVGERGWGLSEEPMSYFPGSTIAGFTPEQMQAQGMATRRATQGSPLLGASKGYASDVLSGDYLDVNKNPALRDLMRTGLEQAMPGINTGAVQSGRYGSNAWASMSGKALADVAANVYNPERERQQAMATIAPQLAQQDYFDIGKLAAIGEERQSMNQALLNEQIARHEFGQLEPWQRLGMFTNLISGDWGGVTQTTSSGGGK